jgi:hypothetical protein
MSKEAMKLALEALEFIPESGSMLGAQAETKRLQGITALREALAEQPAYRAVKTFHEGKPVYVAEQPAHAPQKRPQNCGTGYCSCIECVMEPAVPDALTASDGESAEYMAGWNDCRQAMLSAKRVGV